jgi:hypothetical protein
MTDGAKVMLFSTDPASDRAFVRDLLGLSCMDAGGGWLVFALPAGQSGIDEYANDDSHQLYLHCRDLDQAIAVMAQRGDEPGPVTEESWGRWVSITLPGGGKVRLHESGGAQ